MKSEVASPHMVTRTFEPQLSVRELLTGRQESVNNGDLDTTLAIPDYTLITSQHPINRQADDLVSLQNKPQNQQLTYRPVNTTKKTFAKNVFLSWGTPQKKEKN